jgi:hypothetical protein
MTVPLPAMLADQLGTGPAAIAIGLWPQIMASAREHLIPWVDQNVPELATPARLAFQDLDIVADELRYAVRGAWRRLRAVLVGQTAQFMVTGNGECVIRIISRLRAASSAGAPSVELATEERLHWDCLPEEIRVAGLDGFRSAPIDIMRIRDDLLSGPAC